MLETDASLYLPISGQVIESVLDESKDLADVVSALPVHQLAALIVIQCLRPLDGRMRSPHRMLAEMIELGNQKVKQQGSRAFADEVVGVLDRERIRQGCELLPDHRIVLLDEETLAHRTYLTAERSWDSNFVERHRASLQRSLQLVDLPTGERRTLTVEQTRVFREVRAQTDDHMHVQGYAGTGKSSLIRSLAVELSSVGANVLLLAEHQRQLNALMRAMGRLDRLYPKTFDMLMDEVIPRDLSEPTTNRMRRSDSSRAMMQDDDVIRHLGIQPCGKFSALDVVKVVRSTVAAFCYSGDAEIDHRHIRSRHTVALDQAMQQVVLHHATELWKLIVLPTSRDFRPQLRSHHRIKWAALNEWKVPSRYKHVLLDECHDLPKSMLQILDRSRQAVISLGDEYQNLQGRPQRRSTTIRHREVTQSVRSGRLVEPVINTIIASHPGETKLPFHGNPFTKTEITYHDRPQVPDQPAVILVRDSWALFEWAQRLAQHVDFELLSDLRSLDMFVADCIELRTHGTRARHGELFRFGTWDEAAKAHHRSPGFERIDRMLRQGFSEKHWSTTRARIRGEGSGDYAVGLINDVRNREFEAVMVAPEVVDWAWDSKNVARAEAGSTLYVAVSRAQQRLIVPRKVSGWMEEMAA